MANESRDFRRILAEFLSDNKITQTEFARKIGVKQSQVSEWLKGKAQPGYDTLRQMSIAYGISADYFLGIVNYY
ncbi:MAG: helix-turn-helix domain-containing protein [Clostridiaceae bacterium]|jgi:transcriptional regulator with XRE-family HTH domain|nr:helix-turn-helix domain-containing protein [Clostridiaceae bacterium]